MAQQEVVGGYSANTDRQAQQERFSPARAAPSAPTSRDHAPVQGSLRSQPTAQRPAPPSTTSQSPGRSAAQTGLSQTNNRTDGKDRNQSPGAKYQAQETRPDPSQVRQQPNGLNNHAVNRPPQAVQQPKPLNVATTKPVAKTAADPGRKEAEIALNTKKPEERQKEVRMSSMSESEVMAKLKQVVSKDNPNESYSKQKKIGQGASGSVYVARVKESAISSIARELYRTHGPKGQVAIKQMDLRNQPRKELIVNEIIVMKDSKHPNIVNFLDSFLQEQNNELWVVMEFMEGGALTDVIDNNPVITEDQISTICFETCKGLAHLHSQDIIHRDIKSDNVLLDRIGNVKISKFAVPHDFVLG